MKIWNIRSEDTGNFLQLFHRCMQYAPYTAFLTAELLNQILDKREKGEELMMAEHQGAWGVLHYSISEDKANVYLHLLLADSAFIGESLLDWLECAAHQEGAQRIQCYVWAKNPYRYIIHGTEAYCWAGLYSSNSAFLRKRYDICMDIISMRLHMIQRPESLPLEQEYEIKHEILKDDLLTLHGQYCVVKNGKILGHAGYCYLRTISQSLGKPLGEVDIWFDSQLHATSLTHALLCMCHQKLYDMGIRTVILATNQQLYRAVRFYEHHGYQQEAMRGYCYEKILKEGT